MPTIPHRNLVAGRRRRALALLLALGLAGTAHAATPPPHASAETPADAASRIELWPGGLAPGDRALAEPQRILDRNDTPAHPDRFIQGISRPYLVVYRPSRPNGSALLVTPGGGYQRIVLDNEGTELAPVFAEQAGITLFVLRYRLPGEGHPEGRDVPLADAQRALRLIRARAAEWALDPHRIGVMGFSAGGHVAASLGTRFDERVYPAVDARDALSARPDFQLLIYPVIELAPPFAHAGSRERLLGPHPDAATLARYSPQTRVRADTPPTFLVHAQDDDVVPVENSLAMYDALRRARVASELHLFPAGGHGFGIGAGRGTVAAWPRLAIDWLGAVAPAARR